MVAVGEIFGSMITTQRKLRNVGNNQKVGCNDSKIMLLVKQYKSWPCVVKSTNKWKGERSHIHQAQGMRPIVFALIGETIEADVHVKAGGEKTQKAE